MVDRVGPILERPELFDVGFRLHPPVEEACQFIDSILVDRLAVTVVGLGLEVREQTDLVLEGAGDGCAHLLEVPALGRGLRRHEARCDEHGGCQSHDDESSCPKPPMVEACPVCAFVHCFRLVRADADPAGVTPVTPAGIQLRVDPYQGDYRQSGSMAR